MTEAVIIKKPVQWTRHGYNRTIREISFDFWSFQCCFWISKCRQESVLKRSFSKVPNTSQWSLFPPVFSDVSFFQMCIYKSREYFWSNKWIGQNRREIFWNLRKNCCYLLSSPLFLEAFWKLGCFLAIMLIRDKIRTFVSKVLPKVVYLL